MSADLHRLATTVATRALLIGAGAIVAAPILSEEPVQAVAVVAGGVWLVGRMWHQLVLWDRSRPPRLDPAPSVTLEYGGGWLAELAHSARATEPPADTSAERWQWDEAICRFAFVARWGGFGWRSMCRYVGRADWQCGVDVLRGAGIITGARGNQPPAYQPGWSYSRLRAGVRWGGLELAYPARPPLVVKWDKSL